MTATYCILIMCYFCCRGSIRGSSGLSNGPSFRRPPGARPMSDAPLLPFQQLTITVCKDDKGYGLKISGDNPVYVQSVKEGQFYSEIQAQKLDNIWFFFKRPWQAYLHDFYSLSSFLEIPIHYLQKNVFSTHMLKSQKYDYMLGLSTSKQSILQSVHLIDFRP